MRYLWINKDKTGKLPGAFEMVYKTMNYWEMKKREIVAVDAYGRENVIVSGKKNELIIK